jgi:putative flippase GtrA
MIGGARAQAARLIRFGLVGGLATAAYAVFVAVFTQCGLGPVTASVIAYAAAGAVSYLGHKRVTFRSGGAHAVELPRFVLTLGLGIAVAAAAPAVLTGLMGLPRIVPTVFTCIAAPLLSYAAMSLLVFRGASLSRQAAE